MGCVDYGSAVYVRAGRLPHPPTIDHLLRIMLRAQRSVLNTWYYWLEYARNEDTDNFSFVMIIYVPAATNQPIEREA
jgi:hypothetical protein